MRAFWNKTLIILNVVVGEVKDGLELLELLEQSLPDMVITDISMPRLEGLEATKKIKELYPQIKMLTLTFHREKDYLHQAMLNWVDSYLATDGTAMPYATFTLF